MNNKLTMKNETNLRILRDYRLKSFAIILFVIVLNVAGSVSVMGSGNFQQQTRITGLKY